MTSARKQILENLKQGNHLTKPEKPDFESPIYKLQIGDSLEVFKKNLEGLKGNAEIFETEEVLFTYLKSLIFTNKWKNICCKEEHLQKKLQHQDIPFLSCKKLPKNIEVSITGCEFLAADLGSAIVSSAQSKERAIFFYPPTHIIIAKASQLTDTLEEAYQKVVHKYKDGLPSMITVITGPSRTADIEKTLVLGAHGPKSLYVLISKD